MQNSKELDELKRAVPMHLVAADKLELERRGQEYWALCPFKKEDTPSFSMYREDDGTWLYHCHGCGVTGNIFMLVQQLENCSFPDAVKIIRELAGNPEWDQMRADAEAVFQQAKNKKQEMITVPLAAFDKYVKDMQDLSAPLDWLYSRGISIETAEQFGLGYVQKPLPQIVHPDNPLYDKGWIMFPEVRDGRIVSCKYRSVVAKRIPKTETSPAWSGFAHRKDMLASVLFNQEAINALDDVLVVEGEPDCLVLAQAGFCSVSVASASHNPNEEQRTALMRANARYLAGDMDEVGASAMAKLHKELGGDNPRAKTYLLQWPAPYKDANQYFLEGCGRDVVKFHDEVVRLMDEARDRRLPGIRDLKTVTRTATFKPTHDNPARLTFPWLNIDKWVDILPGEVMFMFATETKMGKSTWLMNVLVHNMLAGKKIVNYSAELSPERYAAMVTAYLVRANRNSLADADFRRAAELIPDDSFYIGYKPGAKFKEVMKLLAEAKQVYGGDIFVVDPLHFILRGGTPGQENSDFASAMADLVNFSIKWNVIVIVVGQARKSMQGARGRVATGQDARQSAALGEDAATTWILHRNRVAIKRAGQDDDEGEPVFEDLTRVKLDYSRNSDPMSGKLIFNGSIATFLPFTNQQPESVPVQQDPTSETAQR